MKYILKGRTPVPVEDVIEWARWFEKADRVVHQTQIDPGCRVSTVFIGIDHAFDGGPPLIFETMIFGGDHADYCQRCSTWEEAEAQHLEALKFFEPKH